MELSQKSCKACERGTPPLSAAQAESLLTAIKEWQINDTHSEISREYRFKNYYRTMAFVNALAWISHQEDHHPDLEVGYNRCLVRYSTHAIGGLSENDFICAAKANALMEKTEQ